MCIDRVVYIDGTSRTLQSHHLLIYLFLWKIRFTIHTTSRLLFLYRVIFQTIMCQNGVEEKWHISL